MARAECAAEQEAGDNAVEENARKVRATAAVGVTLRLFNSGTLFFFS